MLKPLGNRILVEQFDESSKGHNGLVIPDEAKDAFKVAKGRVVAISDNFSIHPLAVGDTVHFDKFAGTRLKDEDGREYLILRDAEVLAKA